MGALPISLLSGSYLNMFSLKFRENCIYKDENMGFGQVFLP
jgi:hypothetical protein